jgi:hypothetical protein
MSKKFLLSTVVTTVVLFLLNAVVFAAFLGDFFKSHPAVSTEFMNQLYLPDNQLVWWAVVLSAIAVGFLVTTVIKWSGARTFVSGLKSGFIFAFLFLCAVDFGLLGTTNNFSTLGAFADLACSTTTITLSGGVAAWMLGRGK